MEVISLRVDGISVFPPQGTWSIIHQPSGKAARQGRWEAASPHVNSLPTALPAQQEHVSHSGRRGQCSGLQAGPGSAAPAAGLQGGSWVNPAQGAPCVGRHGRQRLRSQLGSYARCRGGGRAGVCVVKPPGSPQRTALLLLAAALSSVIFIPSSSTSTLGKALLTLNKLGRGLSVSWVSCLTGKQDLWLLGLEGPRAERHLQSKLCSLSRSAHARLCKQSCGTIRHDCTTP